MTTPNEAFLEGQANPTGRLAAGTYQAEITAARVESSEWGESLFIQWRDLDSGGTVPSYDNLDTEIGARIAGQRLAMFGIYLEHINDVRDACERELLLGRAAVIRVTEKEKDGKTYRNVYINSVFAPGHGRGDDAEPDASFGDDDIPFG